MIQQLVLKETRFLLTWFQPWRGLRHSCSEPSSPTRPHTSLAPQKATSQNHAQKFPIPRVFLSRLSKEISILSGMCTVGFRLAILWQQLSPSGSGVRCSQPPDRGSGKHVPPYTGWWWGPGRHSPKRATSPYVLQRSRSLRRSIPGYRSASSIPHESVLR